MALAFDAKIMSHPHAYTLSLLKFAVDHLPPTFSDQAKKNVEDRLRQYIGDSKAFYEDIRQTIVVLGKESWPYRKAYEEMYEHYGRASEESFLVQKLDVGLRQKYERFIHEGGKISYLEKPRPAEALFSATPFERYFAPEEKFALLQALLAARDAARAEINSLVTGQKKDEYQALVEKYKKEQERIEGRIAELRSLARVSPKWEAGILDQVRTLEEGWSIVEKGVNEAELEKLIEYWQGTLESFLHA